MKRIKEREEDVCTSNPNKLSLQEKLIILRERYKRKGDCIYVALGVTKLSYSRWVSGTVKKMRSDTKGKIIEMAGGLISEEDFDNTYTPSDSLTSGNAPKRRVKAKAEEDFDLIL